VLRPRKARFQYIKFQPNLRLICLVFVEKTIGYLLGLSLPSSIAPIISMEIFFGGLELLLVFLFLTLDELCVIIATLCRDRPATTFSSLG
jgi:hypothetical protein